YLKFFDNNVLPYSHFQFVHNKRQYCLSPFLYSLFLKQIKALKTYIYQITYFQKKREMYIRNVS
ncbi:MAG TPA: hypothetical protein VKY82_02355, partial [Flavobacterium sp.]|nr:hypothetical protein [Flavobacterium sp.]